MEMPIIAGDVGFYYFRSCWLVCMVHYLPVIGKNSFARCIKVDAAVKSIDFLLSRVLILIIRIRSSATDSSAELDAILRRALRHQIEQAVNTRWQDCAEQLVSCAFSRTIYQVTTNCVNLPRWRWTGMGNNWRQLTVTRRRPCCVYTFDRYGTELTVLLSGILGQRNLILFFSLYFGSCSHTWAMRYTNRLLGIE